MKRLSLQALESRRLLAADIGVVDSTLYIEGTQGNDIAEVYMVEDSVVVKLQTQDADGQIVDTIEQSFDANQVDGIIFEALGGDDLLVNETSLPSIMRAGGGNDVLMGGSGDDILVAGPGDDVVLGGGGDDVILGGPGENIIIESPHGSPSDTIIEDGVDADAGGDAGDNLVPDLAGDDAADQGTEANDCGVDPTGEVADAESDATADDTELFGLLGEPDVVADPDADDSSNVDPASELTDPVAIDPVDAEPTDAEPVGLDLVDGDAEVVDPVAIDPVAAEPVDAEPVGLDSVDGDVEVVDPVAIDPIAAEPVDADPVGLDLVGGDAGVVDPVAADPVAADPINDDSVGDNPEAETTVDVVAEEESDNDVIFGGQGDDWIFGEGGDDTIFGSDSPLAEDLLTQMLSDRLA